MRTYLELNAILYYLKVNKVTDRIVLLLTLQ